jgi:hypothetical protein
VRSCAHTAPDHIAPPVDSPEPPDIPSPHAHCRQPHALNQFSKRQANTTDTCDLVCLLYKQPYLIPHCAGGLAQLLQEAAVAGSAAQPNKPSLPTNITPAHAAATPSGAAAALTGHWQLFKLAPGAQQHTHLQARHRTVTSYKCGAERCTCARRESSAPHAPAGNDMIQ